MRGPRGKCPGQFRSPPRGWSTRQPSQAATDAGGGVGTPLQGGSVGAKYICNHPCQSTSFLMSKRGNGAKLRKQKKGSRGRTSIASALLGSLKKKITQRPSPPPPMQRHGWASRGHKKKHSTSVVSPLPYSPGDCPLREKAKAGEMHFK